MPNMTFLAQAEAPPAGGAALDQVILATAGAMLLTGALLYLGLGHRSGRVPYLGRLAAFSERVSGLPGWAALPATIATGALLTALLGFLWDVSLHIDKGRDEGPLANPSHYLILGGLFGIFTAGFIACVLPLERPSRSSIRIVGDWHAPLGGIVLMACGMFALIGFPLDDVWHRIFGQDVTLWGPTHLMLIGGAAMTLIGIGILMVEAERAGSNGTHQEEPWVRWVQRVALSGGLLIGLMVFPVEFDFGVPQFRMVFGPILVMIAAGVGLVATRIWLGRGAALGAVAFFLLVRGAVSVIVGPILGETTPHFALFIMEALVVEAVFLARPRASALSLGLISGVGIGTIGLAAEWAWSNVWMPIPWTGELFPEGAILGFLAAVGGSLIGAWVGERLRLRRAPAHHRRAPRRLGRCRGDPRDRRVRAQQARRRGRERRGHARRGRPRRGDSDRAASTGRRGPGRGVHERHGLARRRLRARRARGDRRARRLHDERAGPDRRHLEDDGAHVAREHAQRDADLPA